MDVRVPREDANDDTATLARWTVADGALVETGQPICELETSKTVFQVVSPASGPLHQLVPVGSEVAVGTVFARVGENTGEAAPTAVPEARKLTRQAEAFVAEHGLDLSSLEKRGIITLDDVRALVKTRSAWDQPLRPASRVIVLGAGSVATQVIDILLHQRELVVTGCLDDNPRVRERSIFGVSGLGPLNELESRYRDGEFDAAVVALGLTDLKLRRRFFERCQELGLALPNVVDPSARLNRGASLGLGNVLCSFVHLGAECELGDNNFVAAHSSLDHHNRIGSHNLFGPGCLLSGLVTVGDNVLFGSGVIVQPALRIGSDSRLASGSVVLQDVPTGQNVRIRVNG